MQQTVLLFEFQKWADKQNYIYEIFLEKVWVNDDNDVIAIGKEEKKRKINEYTINK